MRSNRSANQETLHHYRPFLPPLTDQVLISLKTLHPHRLPTPTPSHPPCWKRLLSNCVHSIDFFPLRRLLSFPLPCRVVWWWRYTSEWSWGWQRIVQKCVESWARTANNHPTLLWDFNRSSSRWRLSQSLRRKTGRRCWCGFGEQENGCFTPPWGDASRSGTHAEYIQ